TTSVVVTRGNLKSRGAGADAALVVTHEAVRTVNREIVRRTNIPRTRKLLVRLHRVVTHGVRGIGGAYMKHHGRFACVDECQDYSMVRTVDRRLNIQFIWQSTRELDPLFLLRYPEHDLTRIGVERGNVAAR